MIFDSIMTKFILSFVASKRTSNKRTYIPMNGTNQFSGRKKKQIINDRIKST